MKTMTCKELGGACDEAFHAETFEEMAELSQNHGMAMAEKGDKEHIAIMEEMRKGMSDPKAMNVWMEEKEQAFNALPDDD